MRRFALITLIALIAPGCSQSGSSAPPGCTLATDARIVTSATPVAPPLAVQAGIAGDVAVVVTLDANSKLVAANVQNTTNSLLNSAALDAVRASTFQTATVNCQPVGATLLDVVHFR